MNRSDLKNVDETGMNNINNVENYEHLKCHRLRVEIIL